MTKPAPRKRKARKTVYLPPGIYGMGMLSLLFPGCRIVVRKPTRRT